MKSTPAEDDDKLRERILHRSQAINIDLVTRLTTVADDLAQGHHLAAIGGFERELNTMRSLLLLLQQE